MNNGGRVTFANGLKVRYLQINGSVSRDIYTVYSENAGATSVCSDRKGHLTLKQESSQKLLKVHSRRILPLSIDNKSPVIRSIDKYRTICPNCGTINSFTDRPIEDKFECECGSTYTLYWGAEKPKQISKPEIAMSNDAVTETIESNKKRTQKNVPVPKLVDMLKLSGARNCQLWTKNNIRFDHVGIDVKAHVILFIDGENSKKFCFNTYDGALGKKSKGLPFEIDDNGEISIVDSTVWFHVKDVQKAIAKFTKDGYELNSKV
jgi:hypothetical protein